MSKLKLWLNITDQEWLPAIFSFLYFFCLMSGYFILRPVRDEMGIQAGVENMQWLFTGTFLSMLLLVPLFGYLTQKVPRKKLIPAIYIFFSINIITFYWAFRLVENPIVSIVFFIWLSVFNLFIISIFWSFNSDIFNSDQAKRLYGPIAAGGSCGALVGPTITSLVVTRIGVNDLLLISAAFMFLATFFIYKLMGKKEDGDQHAFTNKMKGSIWDGLKAIIKSSLLTKMSLYILLYTTISTFLYFQQAHIISEAYASSEDRTTYFGIRDLLVNGLTLLLQFFLTEKIIRKWGVAFCLMLVPAFSAFGFFSLGLTESVYALLIVQVLYRSLNFSIQKPAREVVFTTVNLEERYRSKNFMDTAIYRGGDAMSGWIFTGLSYVLGSLQTIAFVTVPITIYWLVTGLKLGKLFNHKTIKFNERIHEITVPKKSA